jgi:hypothetical protein
VRFADLQVGTSYLLKYPEGRVATVLETSPEAQRKGLVTIRYENGLATGKVRDIGCNRVARPARGREPEKPAQHWELGCEALLIDRDLVIGDEVTWRQSSEWIWTVEAINEDGATADITTTLFESPRAATALIHELRLVQRPSDSFPDGRSDSRQCEPPLPTENDQLASIRDKLAPVKPRRQLDELMDGIVFTNACADQYRRRFAPRLDLPAAHERLREEIRRDGYFTAPARSEFRRIRIPGRFEVVIHTRPSNEDVVKVQRLSFPQSKQVSTRQRRR